MRLFPKLVCMTTLVMLIPALTPSTARERPAGDAPGDQASTGRPVTGGDGPPKEAVEIASTIRGERVASRVRFLASDFMEGREAGKNGERLASEYIRDFYMGLGLSPAAEDGSFYQQFNLRETTLGENNSLEVVRPASGGGSLRTSYPLEEGFLPFNFSPSASVEAPVVFAGYGITAPEHGYDDYAGLDVSGRVVLLMRHEPRESDPDSVFNGLRPTRHAAFLTKVRLAQKKGALGVLFVTDPANHTPPTRSPGNALARWASLAKRDDFDTRPPPDPYQWYPDIAPDVRIPVAHISQAAAADLLAGAGRTLDEIQAAIDGKMRPSSFAIQGVQVALSTDVKVKDVPVRNVVAKLDGSDPALRDEFVVIGGHYDHVGYGHFGSLGGSWGQIHPGADDNASGTATILSVAEAFALAPSRPARSILFVHFTGEEKGLMGSRWFVEHATVPLDRVVAMLNLDMVGRNDPNVLSVNGDAAAAGLDALVQKTGGETIGLTINHDAGSGIDRSDQWSFALKGIPAVAFFSGVHDDYHAPSDTASKIVADKLRNVGRLTAITVWQLAEDGRDAIEPAGPAGNQPAGSVKEESQ